MFSVRSAKIEFLTFFFFYKLTVSLKKNPKTLNKQFSQVLNKPI